MLGACALFFCFIQATFYIPFYSKVSTDKSWQISLQVTAVLVLFTVATLLAKSLLNCVGTKTLCFLSLLLGAAGCILISTP